ncbi:SpoIIE family protein phosphatase [Streptomyces sp. NPDC001222]|uniref:SpoIIE family protein phosphatase n=1 Tax=Streptomyces sp. NPDC001222 TaxID=3364548 RepID=UPI00369FA69A
MTTPDKVPGSADVPATAPARILLDTDGVITEWSEEAQALLGYGPEEMVGRPLWPLLVPPDPAAEPDTPAEDERPVRLRDRSGRTVDTEWRMCPRLTAEGAVTWAVLLSRAEGTHGGEFDRAVLDALMTESPIGLHLLDTDLRVVRFNTASPGMRGVRAEDVIGQPGTAIAPSVVTDTVEDALRRVLHTGRPFIDLTQPGYPPADHAHEHMYSLSAFRLRDRTGKALGVATLVLDVTERHKYRGRLELLHDASMRIGTTLDISRTADELVEVAVGRVADAVSVDVLDCVCRGEAPGPGPIAGEITFRRVAFRSTEAAALQPAYAVGETATYAFPTPLTQTLTDLHPRLIPRIDEDGEWLAHDPVRRDRIRAGRVRSLIVVPLAARGVVLGVVTLYRSVTRDPFDRDDLTVAAELAAQTALCVDNARRYLRERNTALTLQNSLLPRQLPTQSAVDVAFSYLPGHAGGTWYDVIPLSGARVALLVGAVAGEGLRAVATMGRLRAASHSLAALDLAPDEVLAHLDDLMLRLGEEARPEAANDPVETQSATARCTCVIYDPANHRAEVACAGHPPPVLVHPDGHVQPIDAPSGPPLGNGSAPFAAWETQLPEGTLIALYSEGLVGSPAADGIARLQSILGQPHASVQEACDAVIYSELSGRQPQDVVLLLARTRVLSEDRVASWTFPSDPAIVATARTLVDRQLASWGLGDLSFTTELVISELVTNAIRYARGTIQVRLIRDRTLICEVTDGSSAAPHLRHSRATDEGGRGLLLVAQLAHRWGTRRNDRGKTIWAEQTLDPESQTLDPESDDGPPTASAP